jgi:hypothetical protein
VVIVAKCIDRLESPAPECNPAASWPLLRRRLYAVLTYFSAKQIKPGIVAASLEPFISYHGPEDARDFRSLCPFCPPGAVCQLCSCLACLACNPAQCLPLLASGAESDQRSSAAEILCWLGYDLAISPAPG